MDFPQAVRLKAASDKTIESLVKHGVFNLVPITSASARHQVVGTRWVIKIKADSTYKGRHVVQVFWQIPAVDCGGTLAPMFRPQSIHVMRAVASELYYAVLRGRQTPSYYAIKHRDIGQRPDWLQGGTEGLTVQPTMEAGLVAAALTNEEGGVLLQHDAGAGPRRELRQRTAIDLEALTYLSLMLSGLRGEPRHL